jgi:hypothetical protein
MPSTEYFRRQADICLRLSMIASSEEVANRLMAMAQDYTGRADEIEADSTMAMHDDRSERLARSRNKPDLNPGAVVLRVAG